MINTTKNFSCVLDIAKLFGGILAVRHVDTFMNNKDFYRRVGQFFVLLGNLHILLGDNKKSYHMIYLKVFKTSGCCSNHQHLLMLHP